MKFLVVVTPPSIYHGCSTRKTFWEENYTGKKYLFQSVNMKSCGCRKVSKHKEIKGSDKISTLDISANFDSLNKLETTSSESKEKLGRSGKGLVTALAFKTKLRFAKIQKGKVCHWKCQREGPLEDYQRVWENWKIILWEKDPQTWTNFQLLSSSKATCKVYDDIWWTQSAHSRQLCRRDWLCCWALMLRMRTNQKKSLCMKIIGE